MSQNELLRHNIVFFVGSIAVGALNYLLYPVISRILSVQEFGEVQVLVNILMQISVLTNVVSLFVVNVVTNMKKPSEIRAFVRTLEAVTLYGNLIIVVLLMIASPLLANQLKYSSALPFWGVALFVLFNVPVSIRIGYLRSQRAFTQTSYTQIVQGILRLIFAVGAALIGLSVAGVMFGLAGSLLASTFYVMYLADKFGLNVHPLTSLQKPSLSSLKAHYETLRPTIPYMLLITAVSCTVIFLLSVDTIIAKYSFSPQEAGLYGGLSVAARIIFFASSSVGGVLASSVKADASYRSNVRQLLFSLSLALGIGGFFTAFFAWQPALVTKVMVGPEFESHAQLLPTLALAIFCISIINLLLTYHVAVRDKLSGYVGLGASLIVGLSLVIHTASPENLATGFLRGSIFGLILMSLWSVYWHFSVSSAHEDKTGNKSGGGGHP